MTRKSGVGGEGASHSANAFGKEAEQNFSVRHSAGQKQESKGIAPSRPNRKAYAAGLATSLPHKTMPPDRIIVMGESFLSLFIAVALIERGHELRV